MAAENILDDREDIFYLTVDEVWDFSEGTIYWCLGPGFFHQESFCFQFCHPHRVAHEKGDAGLFGSVFRDDDGVVCLPADGKTEYRFDFEIQSGTVPQVLIGDAQDWNPMLAKKRLDNPLFHLDKTVDFASGIFDTGFGETQENWPSWW